MSGLKTIYLYFNYHDYQCCRSGLLRKLRMPSLIVLHHVRNHCSYLLRKAVLQCWIFLIITLAWYRPCPSIWQPSCVLYVHCIAHLNVWPQRQSYAQGKVGLSWGRRLTTATTNDNRYNQVVLGNPYLSSVGHVHQSKSYKLAAVTLTAAHVVPFLRCNTMWSTPVFWSGVQVINLQCSFIALLVQPVFSMAEKSEAWSITPGPQYMYIGDKLHVCKSTPNDIILCELRQIPLHLF